MSMLSSKQHTELVAELPALRRFCLSLVGEPADAEDLLQDTFERALEKGIPAGIPATRWLFRVCKNLWIDEVRYRQVRIRLAHKAAEEPITEDPVEADAEKDRQARQVMSALAQLPEEQQLTLSLVMLQHKSYAEAAAILDVPIGTIMSRVARARRALAGKLTEELAGESN